MKSIVNEASKKLTKLLDFTSWSVSLAFEAILGGGASIRHGAFIRGGRQEPITRSVQLPYCAYVTAFSQTGLFLDTIFPGKCA